MFFDKIYDIYHFRLSRALWMAECCLFGPFGIYKWRFLHQPVAIDSVVWFSVFLLILNLCCQLARDLFHYSAGFPFDFWASVLQNIDCSPFLVWMFFSSLLFCALYFSDDASFTETEGDGKTAIVATTKSGWIVDKQMLKTVLSCQYIYRHRIIISNVSHFLVDHYSTDSNRW